MKMCFWLEDLYNFIPFRFFEKMERVVTWILYPPIFEISFSLPHLCTGIFIHNENLVVCRWNKTWWLSFHIKIFQHYSTQKSFFWNYWWWCDYSQTCPKVDFLVTKTDQTIFWGLFSDQTNTNIQIGKLTISNNNK